MPNTVLGVWGVGCKEGCPGVPVRGAFWDFSPKTRKSWADRAQVEGEAPHQHRGPWRLGDSGSSDAPRRGHRLLSIWQPRSAACVASALAPLSPTEEGEPPGRCAQGQGLTGMLCPEPEVSF